MKKLMLMVCIMSLMASAANAQYYRRTTRTTTYRHTTTHQPNLISPKTYNYPENAPNTDNKNLNMNDKIDKAPRGNTVNSMSNPPERK